MERILYNVVFPHEIDLSALPMQGRKAVDALTFWEPATDYPEWQDVLVYEHLPIVSIWLNPVELQEVQGKGLVAEPTQTAALNPLADYSAPGTIDTAFWRYPLRADLIKAEGIGTKGTLERKVHYYTKDDGSLSGTMENYSNPAFPGGSWASFRANGLVIPVFAKKYGFTKAWAKGFRGQGVKVGLIETYYENGWHPDLTITEAKDFGTGIDKTPQAHVQNQLSLLAGRDKNADGTARTNGLIGALPEAEIFIASYYNLIAAVDYFIANGVDVITISYTGERSEALSAACKKATDKGIAVFVAAGNSTSPDTINELAANTGAMPVGGLNTGDFAAETTALKYLSVQAVAGKTPVFAADCVVLAANSWPNAVNLPGPYQYNRGTSFACPLVAAIYCVYKQAYPAMSLRARIELMKMHSAPVEGYPDIRIPNLNFLKPKT